MAHKGVTVTGQIELVQKVNEGYRVVILVSDVDYANATRGPERATAGKVETR